MRGKSFSTAGKNKLRQSFINARRKPSKRKLSKGISARSFSRRPSRGRFQMSELTVANGIHFPASNFRRYWTFASFILVAYFAIVCPIRLAFLWDQPLHGIWALEYIIDVFFWVDLYFFLFVFGELKYLENKSKHNISMGNLFEEVVRQANMLSKMKIAKHYIRGKFAFDVLALLPIDLLFFTPNTLNLWAICRVARVLKMVHMVRYVQCIEDYLETRRGRKLNTTIVYVSRLILATLFMSIWITCIWYMIGNLGNGIWIHVDAVLSTSNALLSTSKTKGFELTRSLYWTFATMTTVGFGDIHAYTSWEHFTSVFVMLFGVLMYPGVIANVSTILEKGDTPSARLEQKHECTMHFAKYNGNVQFVNA